MYTLGAQYMLAMGFIQVAFSPGRGADGGAGSLRWRLALHPGLRPSLNTFRAPRTQGASSSLPQPWSFQTLTGAGARPGLAAWVGPPLPPPLLSTHPYGSSVSSLAWWPHLFPIWACALRPLLRVVPRVGAPATVSPIHFPRPQPDPSRRATSLWLRPSPTLWVFLCV